jgi:predicted lipid-binding transport protein (Tim44 family)
VRQFRTLIAALAIVFATTVAVDHADARRGGSFGSRGSRTFLAPAPTPTAPSITSPIERTLTPRPSPAAPSAIPLSQPRPGLFGGGPGGGLVRGLVIGGLIGMLLGHGFGGAAGFIGLLLQLGLLALVAMLAMRFFAARSGSMAAGSSFGMGAGGFGGAPFGSHGTSAAAAPSPASARGARDEIGVGPRDLDTFERLLGEIQLAYGHADRAALAARTTPEIGSYFDEELEQNAARGLRNEVADVKLLKGDLAEAWREGEVDYATVAMRYQSRDVTRDRAGRVVEGDALRPTETTEVWTFARLRGSDWRLSAIQEAA